MSLRDVKEGDTVTVTSPYTQGSKPTQHPVTKVGRVYFTAGGLEFAKEDGSYRDKNRQGHHFAYSPAMWARRQAETAARTAVARLYGIRDFSALTDAEVTEMTATLQGIAEKLEKR